MVEGRLAPGPTTPATEGKSMPHPVTGPQTVGPYSEPLSARGTSTWIRLRTLTLLRWVAVAGQSLAVLVASQVLGLAIPVGACALVIGASAIANLVYMTILPVSHRLSSREALVMLLFDLAQLCVLLALTGGLHNPFALLFLVPVTVSATALSNRETAFLGAATAVAVPLAALFHLPLALRDGGELRLPPVLELGHGMAILTGAAFLAIYARRVSGEIRSMSEGLMATQMALARSQKLTDLGAVVAAAAHELGTPLATITLVSAELMEDLEDRPELAALREDAALIRAQADRCRDILRSMGQAGKDDLHMRQAPLAAVLQEAAEPHMGRGKDILFDLQGPDPQPQILRAPEILHGLRNLVQNAVDFAETTVWIDGEWTADRITIRILDDGPGYPPTLLGRIGDPFLRARAEDQRQRPGYEGMGLGLFIAKTLLERTGARLSFANGSGAAQTAVDEPRTGAIVELSWPAARLVRLGGGLGENRVFES